MDLKESYKILELSGLTQDIRPVIGQKVKVNFEPLGTYIGIVESIIFFNATVRITEIVNQKYGRYKVGESVSFEFKNLTSIWE